MTTETRIQVYTDGSVRKIGDKKYKGGWGYVAYVGDPETTKHSFCDYGHSELTTSNIMEMTAAIEAIKKFKDSKFPVTIISDSQYLVKNINERLPIWKLHGWKTNANKPIKNKDLWVWLDKQDLKSYTFEWVKGHSGDHGNERADELANWGSDQKGYKFEQLDREDSKFSRLNGKHKHYCMEWDQMAIDASCPEYECCRCYK